MTLWELPQTLIGWLVVMVLGGRIVRVEHRGVARVYRYRPGKVLWGVSLGSIIVLADHPYHDEMTVRHEYGHSLQSRKLGPLYLIVVGIPSILRAAWWWVRKLPVEEYYRGYPEAWADRLGGVERAPT